MSFPYRQGTIREYDPAPVFYLMTESLVGQIRQLMKIDDPTERDHLIEQDIDYFWNGPEKK